MAKLASIINHQLKKPKVDFTPADALKAAGYKFAAMTNSAAAMKKSAAAMKKSAMKKSKLKKAADKQKVAKTNPLQKKPASAGLEELNNWAQEQSENDEQKPDGDNAFKDTSAPTKAQSKVFANALAKPAGTVGALPAEIHTLRGHQFKVGQGQSRCAMQ